MCFISIESSRKLVSRFSQSTTLHYTTLHYTTLHCTTLHYATSAMSLYLHSQYLTLDNCYYRYKYSRTIRFCAASSLFHISKVNFLIFDPTKISNHISFASILIQSVIFILFYSIQIN